MKCKAWFGITLAGLVSAMIVQAETVDVVEAVVAETSAEFAVDYFSAYVWRGQVCNSAAVVQPAIAVEMPFGLALGAWGNMDATKKNNLAGKFNEVDLSAFYALPIESLVSVELGIVNYLYPYNDEQTTEEDGEVVVEAADETTEISAIVSFDVLLNPTIELVRDVDDCGGFYGSVGIGHSLALTDQLSLDLAASIGWADKKYNEFYFGNDNDGFNDLSLSIGSSYEVMENVSVGATVAYSYLLDSDVRDAAEEAFGYKDHLYGGLNLTYDF
ncbi:MAG: MipA/OmpV family protein [Kiritimatiellae bacterium]|nr:MipA/OmpV family protein [Kiritimatiellia bacterium]